MKITVFGASSPSGRVLVEKALEQGHELTAFVRDRSKLALPHARLNIIEGDALNAAQVDAAVQGSEAVISFLGPKRGAPKNMTTQATQNILNALTKHGVRRLVITSVGGIAVPGEQRSGVAKVVDALIKLLARDVYLDREQQLALLFNSPLDWVAVRLPRLTDEPATGSYQVGNLKVGPSLKISRADLADFMLKQLTDNTYLRQAPIISN